MVLGFEPTALGTWVSSHDDLTSAPAQKAAIDYLISQSPYLPKWANNGLFLFIFVFSHYNDNFSLQFETILIKRRCCV